jgi:hypothetical protein
MDVFLWMDVFLCKYRLCDVCQLFARDWHPTMFPPECVRPMEAWPLEEQSFLMGPLVLVLVQSRLRFHDMSHVPLGHDMFHDIFVL